MSFLFRIVVLTLVGVSFFRIEPVLSQEKRERQFWKGEFSDGTIITEIDLTKILTEHKQWLETSTKEGARAILLRAKLQKVNLHGADLRRAVLNEADLRWAILSEANLSEAELGGATLSGASLNRSNLRGAKLYEADLIETDLSDANLAAADFTGAIMSDANLQGAYLGNTNLTEAILGDTDLRKAILSQTNLHGAYVQFVNFSGCYFDPRDTEDLLFLGARGLSNIRFTNPSVMVKLRKAAKESGLRNEERAITSALKKYQISSFPQYALLFEDYFLGGKLTDYGAKPWHSLALLFLLVIPFGFLYMMALKASGEKTGIWVVRQRDNMRKSGSKKTIAKLSTRLAFSPLPNGKLGRFKGQVLRHFRILRIGLYFSILSAFSIGWRELNVSNWIARLQQQEYSLKSTGWVRTVSGVQSLLSVYLLALWTLTYFGRPFE